MIKVLVVDDNKDNRMTIKLLLEDFEEILLIEAEDGKKAIEITAPIVPDIIFMDIMMPIMDGIEATQEIRKFDKKVLIVALSALSDDEHQSQMLKAGAEDYITKPINDELFAVRMNNYLSIIEHRRSRGRMDGAVNLFSKTVHSKKTSFFVEDEVGLIEFWEYAAEKSADSNISDAIRAVYNIGLNLLVTNKNFTIVVEEDDSTLYFSIVAIKVFTPQHIRDIFSKEGTHVTLAIRNNEISISTPKGEPLQSIVKKEKIILDDSDTKILRMEHTDKLSAADFTSDLDSDMLDKLDKLESNEEILDNLIYEYETKREHAVLAKIADELAIISRELELLYEFYNLNYALGKLNTIIRDIPKESLDETKSKKLAIFLRNMFEDFVNWRETIFVYKNTDDIHYLDSSLLSSCLQVELLLKNMQTGDEDNDIELF